MGGAMEYGARSHITNAVFRRVCVMDNVRRMTIGDVRRSTLLLVAGAVCLACRRTAPPAISPMPVPPPVVTAESVPPVPPPLPPVPAVSGPLQIRVVYPPPNHLIESRDSNYVFGSVGNGQATLTVNGAPARVYPNGAFMVWLANPPAASARYDLVAVIGTDTARATLPVRVAAPRPVLAAAGPLVVDSGSITPRGIFWLRDSETVRVSVRAPANASVGLVAGPMHVPLAHGVVDSLRWSAGVPAALLRGGGTIVVTRGADVVRLPIDAVAPPTENGAKRYVAVNHSPTLPDTDYVISGRPVPGDTYRWFVMPDTKLEVTGRDDDYYRVRLDDELEIWVSSTDVRFVRADPPPHRVTENAHLRADRDWVDLVIPMGDRPAYFVEEGHRALQLTLYDTRGNTDVINYPTRDSLITDVEWSAPSSDRVRYTVHLSRAPFGYLVMFDRTSLVLRVRRPPAVDRERPLAGRTIAVDPGHPPAGATGPTGLYEGDAVLAVGERLRQLLEERGATVVMTRTTRAPVDLNLRPVIARRANAEAFVSLHLNAYPDGVDPFTAPNGSGTYFYREQSVPLARAVQRGLLANIGLPDEGIFFRSLAVVRHSWMPAVLTEGAFVIVPEQEAAMRTPEVQDRYAKAIADGLEAYFRSLTTR